jgi:hypothetical protein
MGLDLARIQCTYEKFEYSTYINFGTNNLVCRQIHHYILNMVVEMTPCQSILSKLKFVCVTKWPD